MQNKKADYQRWYRSTENGKAHRRITDARARLKHKERRRVYNLNYGRYQKYGITPDIYEAIMYFQNNKCPICLRSQSEITRRFTVDHDHKTGRVRGLLCTRCNGIIVRLVEHEYDKLNRAELYLKAEVGYGRNWVDAK